MHPQTFDVQGLRRRDPQGKRATRAYMIVMQTSATADVRRAALKSKCDELPANAGAPDVWPNPLPPPDPKPPAPDPEPEPGPLPPIPPIPPIPDPLPSYGSHMGPRLNAIGLQDVQTRLWGRTSVHPVESDPTSRLCKHSEARSAPVSIGLENQSAKVTGVKLACSCGLENDRRFVAVVDGQFSIFS